MNPKTIAVVFLIGAVAIFAVVIVPLALIWALNTLFPGLAIPVNGATWLAMFLITAAFSARAAK